VNDPRPFRFGVQVAAAGTRREWLERAEKAEALGYDVLVMPDHLERQFSIGPALAIAAAATTTLRIATLVWQNDLRHPVLVAQEAATLDVLSDGRFELGLGAGGSWMPDYERTGMRFAPSGERVGRLEEGLQVIKGLLSGEPFTFAGQYYTVSELEGFPVPTQRPHPPILVGGGGPRLLTIAAREANIVSIFPSLLPPGGQFALTESTAMAFDQKVALVRQAAGSRSPDLEFHVLLQGLFITDDVRRVSDEVSQEWVPLTPAEALASPYLLIGSVDAIVGTLRERRERHGISYVVVFEAEMEVFAPVVARLTGT
jgi:probable F420-dependent oxidoreductase